MQNFSEALIRRRAIEHFGISECDIRDVEGTVVRLWNRRKIDVSQPCAVHGT